jgi:hypothetical protein
MGVRIGAYRVFVGRPEGIRPLGRPRRRWEYNITMESGKWEEVGWVVWTGMIWSRTRTGGGIL